MSNDGSAVIDSAVPLARDSKGRWLRGRSRSRSMVGNLNGTRYPWRVYWRKRALRPEERWVLTLVAGYGHDLISDKGGEEGITAGERRLVELAVAARVCWLLAIASSTEGSRAEAAKFMNVERQCLQALRTERRARPAPTLAQLLQAREQVTEDTASRPK